MKKLVILLALVIGLSASTASAVGVIIRGPGIVTCRVVATETNGKAIRTFVLDTNPTTPAPYLFGVVSRSGVFRLQIYNAAVGGTLVASGTFDQTRPIYIVYNGATWTLTNQI